MHRRTKRDFKNIQKTTTTTTKKLTPESERGSSVCLASTSLLLDSRARGLHLPQRRNTGAHSRLPDTHRCGGRLKITPFSRSIAYRRLQRIPGEGFSFHGRTRGRVGQKQTARLAPCLSPRRTGERLPHNRRERRVTAYLHVTGGEGGREGGRGKGESIGWGWPNQFGRLSTRGRLLWVRTEGKLASGLGYDCQIRRRRRRKEEEEKEKGAVYIHIHCVCV